MAIARDVLAARHRMLPEIGDAGVARLASATVQLDAGLSSEAARVARAYLERSGVTVLGEGRGPVEDAALAHLTGAHFAMEATARIVGAREGVPTVPLAVLADALAPSGGRRG